MSTPSATILVMVSSMLQDTGNALFSTTEIGLLIPELLNEVSRARPRQTKETLTTTIGSKDLTLTGANKLGLLWVEGREYKVDLNPQSFRNFKHYKRRKRWLA